MTKANIRSNLTIFIPDITATKAKGLNYILGETNSYSCHVSLYQCQRPHTDSLLTHRVLPV